MPLPLAVPIGAALLGGILKTVGKNKERNANVAEAKRLEEEARARARGKAALMRGILNANGYGNIMTDEQILAYLTKTDPRPNTSGSLLGDIGSGIGDIGKTALLGSTDTENAAQTASQSFWDWLNSIASSPAPRTGGFGGWSGTGTPGVPAL